MKTLAILLLGVALAYAEIRETAFRPGREYVYEYEGQLLSGLPKTSKEHSGLKIKCKPTFQFTDDNKVIMRLDEISLHRLQREVDDPMVQQPVEKFQEVTGEEAEIFRRELSRPVRFTYRQGKISDIETSPEEPLWCTNDKRGIMNLLQLNLNERENLDETKNLNRPTSSRNDRDMTTLRVKEEGISGNCESLYRIKFDKTDLPSTQQQFESTNVMNITKIRDLENCVDRQRMEKSTLSGLLMREDKKDWEKDLIKSFSQVRYNVSGDRERFMIESAVSEGKHIFSPYQNEETNVITFVNQTLVLKKADKIRDEIEMPRDTKKQGSIRYEFPEKKQLVEKTQEEIQRQQQQQSQLKKEEIREDVKTLMQFIIDSLKFETISEETPSHLVMMVQKLRDLKKDDIRRIYDEVVRTRSTENKDEERKRKLMWDVLPLINTEESIKFIKEKIESREIEGEMASQILNTIAVIHDPTIQTLDDVLELCKSNKVVEQKEVRKTCWLSFGSMIHNTFSETKKNGKVQTQIREIQRHIREERAKPMTSERIQLIERLERRLKTVTDQVNDAKKRYTINLTEGIKADKPKEEQKMCIKAIANSGLKDTVQDIQNIIESRAEDEIKVQAIYSLRRLSTQIPSKVRNILTPVFFNQELSPEIRIAAYVVTMESNVTTPVMQLFAQSLRKERSQQVGSFVYSHLKSISKSSHPMDKKKAISAEYVLRFAKPITPGAHYSKNLRISKQSKEFDVGFVTEVNTLGTPESVLPRSANCQNPQQREQG